MSGGQGTFPYTVCIPMGSVRLLAVDPGGHPPSFLELREGRPWHSQHLWGAQDLSRTSQTGKCIKNADSDSVGLGWGPRCCVSNLPPSLAGTAGPGTIFGAAGPQHTAWHWRSLPEAILLLAECAVHAPASGPLLLPSLPPGMPSLSLLSCS